MAAWIWASAVLLIVSLYILFVAPPPVMVPIATPAAGGKTIGDVIEDRLTSRITADHEGGVRARLQFVDNGITTFEPEENCLSQ